MGDWAKHQGRQKGRNDPGHEMSEPPSVSESATCEQNRV